MAKVRIPFSKQALAATALMSAAIVSGCSTVEHASLNESSTVQTVAPASKPGMQTAAAEAAPSTVGKGETETDVATTETGPAPATDATLAFAAPQTAIPTARPDRAFEVAMATPDPSTAGAADASARVEPAASLLGVAASWESDFDAGEPVGLETLVAKRMIIPTERPKTGVIGSAVDAVANVIPDSLKLTKTPTSSRPELDRLIKHYADLNGLPLELVHRVVKRESSYNPRAYSKGNYGLMQIRYNTAKGLGYEGPPEGLFDAETNLKYATRYLRGAWLVADNQHDGAVRLYASGYYYHAKRKGMLDELGMR